MTFAQQEPSAKAPCTRTMVLIAMILLLVSKACRLNVAVVHAGHYRTGTSVRPVKQSKTSQAGSGRLRCALINPLSVSAAQSMSASRRKRPQRCAAAKSRDATTSDVRPLTHHHETEVATRAP